MLVGLSTLAKKREGRFKDGLSGDLKSGDNAGDEDEDEDGNKERSRDGSGDVGDEGNTRRKSRRRQKDSRKNLKSISTILQHLTTTVGHTKASLLASSEIVQTVLKSNIFAEKDNTRTRSKGSFNFFAGSFLLPMVFSPTGGSVSLTEGSAADITGANATQNHIEVTAGGQSQCPSDIDGLLSNDSGLVSSSEKRVTVLTEKSDTKGTVSTAVNTTWPAHDHVSCDKRNSDYVDLETSINVDKNVDSDKSVNKAKYSGKMSRKSLQNRRAANGSLSEDVLVLQNADRIKKNTEAALQIKSILQSMDIKINVTSNK